MSKQNVIHECDRQTGHLTKNAKPEIHTNDTQ